MAFNGSGLFERLYNWVTDRDSGIKIRADRMDAELDGIAAGLSTALLKDGTQTVTANIPFATYRVTGLGDPVNAQDAATKNWVETVLRSTFTDDVFNILDNADNTKKVAFQLSGITASTTRVLTVPDSDGTLLTTAFASLSDAVFTLQDDSDATKQLQFQLSGIDAATTRTLTTPNSSGTLLLEETIASYIAGRSDIGSSVDTANDYLLLWDATDSSTKKVSPDEFGGGGAVDIQEFSASGTWNKPSSGTVVEIWCFGGGGGGGSGCVGASGNNRSGGGGGEGGGISRVILDIGDLGATETVTIGAGGNGGAAQTSSSTNGNNGTAGGSTSFGTHCEAQGGDYGNGGVIGSAASGGSTSFSGNYSPGSNGGAGNNGAAGGSGNYGNTWLSLSTLFSLVGGGGGGAGINSAGSEFTGGSGRYIDYDGTTGTVSGGSTNGGNGNNGVRPSKFGSAGGSGGGSDRHGNGGAGGNGIQPGSGGGGGGATEDGNSSGAGGSGGDGFCIVITK